MRYKPFFFGLLTILATTLLPGCPSGAEIRPSINPPMGPQGPQEFAPFQFVLAGDPQMGMTGTILDKARFVELAHQANELKPAFVLVAGDLVHLRTQNEWAAFDEALREFRVPVKLIPGNHDLYGNLAERLAYYRENYGYDYYVYTYNNCDIIALNSTVLSRSDVEPYIDEGRAQWDWAERAIADSKRNGRTHVFILMHRPPFLKTPDDRESASIWEKSTRKRLLDLCRRYGVKVFLCGHVHRSYEIKADGFEVYTVAGTAISWLPPGLGYRVFNVHQDRIEQYFVPLDHPPSPANAPLSRPATMSAK